MAKAKVKAKKKACKAGWQCGKSCISRKKTCRKNLKNPQGKFVAQTYADYVISLAVKNVQEGKPAGAGLPEPDVKPREPVPDPKGERKPASSGLADTDGFRLPSNPAKKKEITDSIKPGKVNTEVQPRDLTQAEHEAIKELIPQKGFTNGLEANSVSDRLRFGPDSDVVNNMSQRDIADLGRSQGIAGTLAYTQQLREGKEQLDPKDPLRQAFDIMIANGEARVGKLWEMADDATRAKVLEQISVGKRVGDISETTGGLLEWQE